MNQSIVVTSNTVMYFASYLSLEYGLVARHFKSRFLMSNFSGSSQEIGWLNIGRAPKNRDKIINVVKMNL